ncbi:MAG: LeuA family protein [Rhodospirillales bacterium]|nr:pyruvate carboxyltransferase [Gammaproteobacteria bacterium]OUT80176.1 MAG: pyruvate carboxyltransferase [Rhodospirillaceae bacterium TMED23]|tara:strand:+ start:24098 stop:25324 length:1227 start_codon:yes stop_codon:yes gene_type:complete
MTDTPWKQDGWFTSPWNFDPEVTKDWKFPNNIRIHDVTLRDGEQQAGLAYNYDDKIRIAEGLAEIGVQRLEAGMPVVSKDDAKVVTELARRDFGPKVYSFARCMVDDVKRAVDAGVNGVIMEVPASPHLIEKGYRWELDRAIDLSIESTSFARDQGLEVVFFPIDFTRSDLVWVCDLIERVGKEGHMDGLALVDTMGATSIHAMQFFVRTMKNRFPDIPLEAHFHMDFGMGIANTIMALSEGVEVIQSTVLGVGERAGNVPMEETVMALKCLYNIDIGIKTEGFKKLADMVAEISNIQIASNRPIVGDNLFKVESGIIATWLLNCGYEDQTEVVPFRPSLVGQDEPEAVMGKGSGIDNCKHWLDKFQIQASEEQAMEVLMAVKDWGLIHKRLMTDNEFSSLAKDVLEN